MKKILQSFFFRKGMEKEMCCLRNNLMCIFFSPTNLYNIAKFATDHWERVKFSMVFLGGLI